MTNVLIVDDHPIVRRGLRDILTEVASFNVTETANAHDAINLIKQQSFDLAVVDLDLPGMSGLELLKEIKRINKRLHVLILSVYPEDQFAVRVLKAGADGFISKEAAPDQLVLAIRKILKGGKHISERVADLLLEQVDGRHTTPVHGKLSDREFQILCLIGEGKTIKQIANMLSLSAPTVSTYRARILNKLDRKSTAELVRYAIENQISRPK
jgi:two-component system, NarL family, invasion response regulator UvrY